MIEVKAFVAIAQAGSVSRAAVTVRLSQPAMSRRIALLEQETGVPLFNRVPSGLRLTEAGQAFLPFAHQVLAAARDGAEAAWALETGEHGTVTLALVGTLASTGLTAQSRAFREAWPAVRLLLHTARSAEVSALAQSGQAQLGLHYFGNADHGLVAQPVMDEQLQVLCAAQSRLVDASAGTAAALAGVPWVGFPLRAPSSGASFARVLEQQLARNGLGDAEYIAIDSLTAQKRLIQADFGVGLLPSSAIDEELRQGTLRIVAIPTLESAAPVTVIHRRHGYLSGAARRLLAMLSAGA